MSLEMTQSKSQYGNSYEAASTIDSEKLDGFPDSPSRSSANVTTKFATKNGKDLKWKNVNFSVKGKQILKDCWGQVPSGKTCAMMGASGAGKSSMLNVLAGRSTPSSLNVITGRVNVNGEDIDPVTYRQNIAYVMQEDSLMATATPREALEFSAVLRLPKETTPKEIEQLVDTLLTDLGLLNCADVMIGGPLIKGISGGQKKRTAVGIELITNPSLLFLDEPTSGLDSYSAYSCVNLLKNVASFNTAVLCTIHQPSSEIFFLFDLVIFMNNGRILYQGSPIDAISHFNKCGYTCPSNYNPSDYIMFISQTETVETLEARSAFMDAAPIDLFPDEGGSQTIKSSLSSSDKLIVSNASIWKQLYLLSYREIINNVRDIDQLLTRFGSTIFLNLIYGLIFLKAGSRNNADSDNVSAHFGAMMMIAISSMFGTAEQTLLMFPFERPLFLREYSTGTYSAFSYFVSKIVVELPLTFIQTLIQFIIVYFLVDMQGSFIYLVLISWALGVASCSVSVLLGCLVADVKQATELSSLAFIPQILFAGFFIRLSKIPVFLRWAQYLCALKYAMNLILATEFRASSSSCQGDAHQNCVDLLEKNDVDLKLIWFYIVMLIVLFVSFRSIGAYFLVEKAKKFY